MLSLLTRVGGFLTKGRLASLFLIGSLSASTWAFYKGFDIGKAVAQKNVATAVLEATNKAREEEQQFYKQQLAIIKQSHAKELALEKANVKTQTIIQEKIISKEKACTVTKDSSQPVFTNEYVRLYNDAVRSANTATQEGDRPGVTKTLPADEGSDE